jgi:hypothetical protein
MGRAEAEMLLWVYTEMRQEDWTIVFFQKPDTEYVFALRRRHYFE